jgi:hypothetical protein
MIRENSRSRLGNVGAFAGSPVRRRKVVDLGRVDVVNAKDMN